MERDATHAARLRLRLGEVLVDCGRLQAIDAAGSRSIPPRALAVLLELAARPLATVTRDELLDAVWKDSFPTPDALSHAIKELRRALGDDAREPRFIATVHGLGYRLLVAPEVEPGAASAPLLTAAVASVAAAAPGAAVPVQAPVLASAPAGVSPSAPRSRAWRWLRHPLPWAAAALFAVVVAVGASSRPAMQQPSAPPAPLAQGTLEPLTADLGRESLPAISPDGSAVAYAFAPSGSDAYRIHIRGVGALASRQLSALEEPGLVEAAPAWSLDGTRLAFFRYRSTDDAPCHIVVADVHAGTEDELPGCHGHVLQHLSWTGDGSALVISVPERDADQRLSVVIHTMPLDDRVPRALVYARASGMIDVEPRVSPDGRWIAFRRGANPYTDLYLMRADGSGLRRLTDWALPTRGFTWLPDSRTLVVSVNDGSIGIRLVSIDGEPAGELGEGWREALAGAAYPSAAARGKALVFARYSTELQLSGWPLRRAGASDGQAPAPQVASSRSDWDAAVAPVGGSVAFVSDRLGDPALLLAVAAPGAPVVQLARHPGMRPRAPAWSADARSIAYVVQGSGRSEGYVVDVERRTATRIGDDGESVRAIRFTPSGELVVASDRGGSLSLWLVDATGAGWRPLDVPGATLGAVAADGTLFFMREGDARLYRRALDGGPVDIAGENLALVESGSWVLQRDGIYAVRVRPTSLLGGQSIDYLPWPAEGGGRWTTAADVPEGFSNPRISLSDETGTVYAAKQRLQGADLFVLRWEARADAS